MKEDKKIPLELEVNRRKLLKILVASGGAVVASTMIPGKWLKPVVDVGVLPAHAQLSTFFACTTIDITNNWNEPVYVDYRICQSGRSETDIIPGVGGPNTFRITVREGTSLEMGPQDHTGRLAFTTGGAAAGMTVVDYGVDLHLEDTLSPGATGTIVVTPESP